MTGVEPGVRHYELRPDAGGAGASEPAVKFAAAPSEAASRAASADLVYPS